MKNPQLDVRPDTPWQPRKTLRAAEDYALRCRKALERMVSRKTRASGRTDDAVAIALLIELLAHYGQKATAADAIEIAEYVDQLIDLLTAEIDAILIS